MLSLKTSETEQKQEISDLSSALAARQEHLSSFPSLLDKVKN
jgi:hypothetical protein